LLRTPDTISYISSCEYDNQRWYMALGKSKFYFINMNLETYMDPPIPYKKIESVRLCTKKKTLM